MSEKHYTLNDFQFNLPDELIAQEPVAERDKSRILVLDRKSGLAHHHVFQDILLYLAEGDLLVFNDARVISARIQCRRATGGAVEIVLARHLAVTDWLVISNRSARLRIGEELSCAADNSVKMRIIDRMGDYFHITTSPVLTREMIDSIGSVPLPPYIRRETNSEDRSRYQTVYARSGEAAAAPTAGLHFTTELLDDIRSRGIETVFLTLDVSWGTFQPVRQNDLFLHDMHTESYHLPQESADSLNRAREEGRRIIAVGTTSLRVLETVFDGTRYLPGKGETSIFIYPPMKTRSCDALVTNFHTPGSTLLMLVCAFAGYELTMETYRRAVDMKYRFFSYGDAMLIL